MGPGVWYFLATLITVLVPLVLYLFNPHSTPETAAPAVVKPPHGCRRCPHTHPTLPSPTIQAPTLPGLPTLPPLTVEPPPVVVPTQPPPTLNFKPPPAVVPLPTTIKPPPPIVPAPTPPIILNPPPSLPTLPPPSPPSPRPPSPPPPAPSRQEMTCPIDPLKLNGCVNRVAGLVHVGNGGSAKEKCCPVLLGLVGLDAAVCLCTTIKAKLLSISVVLPNALKILVQCGNSTPPPGFTCH